MLACEVMKTDGAIRNLIREGKTPQIANSIQTTGNIGNILMDKALNNLLAAGSISRETYEAALRDQSQSGKKPIGAASAPPPPAPDRGGIGLAPGFKRPL